MVPEYCFDTGYSPTVYLTIRKINPQRIIYEDIFNDNADGLIPILIPAGTYKKGDIFMVQVLYYWNGSPARDYTLSIYTAMNNILITNSID